MLQPIDSGIGSTMKTIIGQDEPGNLDAWEGQPDAVLKLDAKTRRILITHWVGKAWKRLTTLPIYNLTFRKCFMRIGALITAEGSNDHEIQPMVGLPGGYKVPEMVEIDDDHPAPEVELDPVAPEVEPEIDGEQDQVQQNGEHADIVEDPYALTNNDANAAADATDAAADYDDAQDEVESWNASVEFTNEMDPSLAPVRDDDPRIPSRLNGRYVLIKLDGEWDCAKVESSATAKKYRYRLEASRVYGYDDFSNNMHGRYSQLEDNACR